MKLFSVFFFLAVLAQPGLAKQKWSCEGRGNDGDGVWVGFVTHSNTVIGKVLVRVGGKLLFRTLSIVRRDPNYKPTRYKGFNRYSLGQKSNRLSVLLPEKLASYDDEFTAYLQVGMGGSSAADTVKVTCLGAGGV